MLNNSSESGHPFLVPDLTRNAFSFSPMRIMFAVGLSYLAFTMLRLWRRRRHPTPVLLPGKSHEWRSLVGCSPWSREKSDTTERLHFHFSLSCIGEGNGNPHQCSCLEDPGDGGASWAVVYGVAQSWTRLKRLSSSSPCHCPQKALSEAPSSLCLFSPLCASD